MALRGTPSRCCTADSVLYALDEPLAVVADDLAVIGEETVRNGGVVYYRELTLGE